MKYEITFIDGSRKTIETEMSFAKYFNRYNQSQPFDEIDGVIINFANVLYIEKVEYTERNMPSYLNLPTTTSNKATGYSYNLRYV